jgi:hypothetical protein
MGEVMLPVRGGTEAFHAYAADDLVIPDGARVAVVEYEPPRTVVGKGATRSPTTTPRSRMPRAASSSRRSRWT